MQQYTELCYCVSYSRTLILESTLGNAVVENTNHMHGVFVPPVLKKASRVFLLQIMQTLLNIPILLVAKASLMEHIVVYQKADVP